MKKVFFGGNAFSNKTQIVQVVFHLDKKECSENGYTWYEHSFPFKEYKDVVKGLNLLGKQVTMVFPTYKVYYDSECKEHKKLTEGQANILWNRINGYTEKSLYLKGNRWYTNLGDLAIKMPVDMMDLDCDRNKRVLTLNLVVADME